MNSAFWKSSLALLGVLLFSMTAAQAQRRFETLGRGVVALRATSSQVYVGWRLLGDEPPGLAFNVYRSTNGAAAVKLNASPVTRTTDFLDVTSSAVLAGANSYHVRPLINGVEGPASASFVLPANAPVRQYLAIPKSPLAAGSYSLSQVYPADVDGDGEFELICRLAYAVAGTPANGRFLFECYRADGSHLWTVRGGPGLLDSNDGDGFLSAADYDGDGRAEVALRTTNGTVFANGATLTDTSSQEFISILDGLTGVERARTPFKPALGPDPYGYWGENMRPFYLYMATACLDGVKPSLITCRGIGGDRLHLHAWDFSNGTITERWSWIASASESMATGHNLLVFDLDNDQKDEIVFIGGAIDDDGRFMYSTGLGHGDHFRFADLDPDRPGFECFAIQQDAALGSLIYDGSTGRAIRKWYLNTPGDPSRGDAGDVDPNFRGAEVWSVMPNIWTCKGGLIGRHGIFPSRGIWWDRDLQREIYSGAGSGQTAPVINKINSNHDEARLYSIYNEGVSQGFGGFPPFSGDLLGDWREEVVLDTSDRSQIRIYSTRIPAENRFYTLMQNPAYRVGATCKGRTGAISPDYYLGGGMAAVPPPPMVASDVVWKGGAASNLWDVDTTANWRKAGASLKFLQGQSVLFDLTGANAAPVQLATTLTPSSVTVHSPVPYTFAGAGALAGGMPLVKAGAGTLTIQGIHPFSGSTTVWDGALIVNGKLTQSPVTVHGGTWGGAPAGGRTGGRIGGNGEFGQGVTLEYGAAITPGNGMGAAGTLTIRGTLAQRGAASTCFDLSDDPTGTVKANDRLHVIGDLQLSGTNTIFIQPLNGSLAPGTYTLVTYTGTLTGGLDNLALAGLPGLPAFLANPPGAITLVIPQTRPPAGIVWTGSQGGVWDLAQTPNWQRGAAADIFVPGDAVRFDDGGAANPTVDLTTTVGPASVTVDSSAHYRITGQGRISGGGGLTKSGSGTLTLLTDNDYRGVTRIQGGVLEVPTLAEAGQPSPIGAAGSSPDQLLLDACTFRMLDQGGGFTNRGATLGAGGVTMDVLSAGGGMTIGGTVTGTGMLAKTGPGTLQFTAANSYSGGTVIHGGTISLGSVAANSGGLGSGPVTFLNGTLTMANIESSASAPWNMSVPAGSSGRLNADGRCSLRGTLSGGGDFTVSGPYVRTDLHGNWSQFSGRLHLLGDLRVANTFGYGNAAVHLGDCNLYSILAVPAAGITLDLGELSGVTAARLRGAATSNNLFTWRVGALNTDATFAGNIEEQNASSATAITKVGTGTWTLAGTNTHRGATTVSAGTLAITGSLGASHVTVQSGATLRNAGTITGNVSVLAGGTLSPAGTINGNLTNHGVVRITGNDILSVSGTFTNHGTLDLGSWGGTLPANFINYGTVIQAPLPVVAITSPAADPVQLAGVSTRLQLRASVQLGTAHQWSRVSGPGEVVFGDATALETTALFTVPGAYVVQLTATNASGIATARRGVLVGDQQTYTLREGENGYAHLAALIRGDSPSWNSGARDQFLVGRTGSEVRTVFSFDLPALPSNAVSAITLDLWTHSAAGTVADLKLHPLAGAMIEGTGNSSSDTGNGAGSGVTWLSRNGQSGTGNTWASAGGDFGPSELSNVPGFSATAGNLRRTFPSTASFVAAARSSLAAGEPLGLLLRSPGTTTNNQFVRFASDDFATLSQRPLLTIQLAGTPLPSAFTGSAPPATEGVAASLQGSVSGSATTSSWSLVSGPGGAEFADPSQAATTVTFDRPGRHVLRLGAADANGETSATLEVHVNANPLAPGASVEVERDRSVDIPLPMSDPDGDPLTIVSFTQGGLGTVRVAGSVATYTAASATGADSFTYTVSDGRGGLALGTVAVTVTAPPLPVVAITSPAADAAFIPDPSITIRMEAAVDSLLPAAPLWSKVSGPGEIIFGNLSASTTTARFSATGVYVVQCAATSTAGIATARRTVIVGVQTLALRQGVGGYSHLAAMIRGDTATWNSGARDQMLVGKLSGGQGLRTLLSFGLDAIPSGATVTAVSLDLWTSTERGPGAVGALELRPLIGQPVEGSGSSATDTSNGAGTGVTWLSRNGQSGADDLWPSPGGHFGDAVLSTLPGFDATIRQALRSFPNTADLTAAAQAAVDERQPLGLMILSPATEQGVANRYVRFASDDAADAALRPRLTITFSGTPVSPATPASFADWQAIHWPGLNQAAIVGPAADPDGDGLENLVEFALLLPPDRPSRLPAEFGVSTAALEFSYTRNRHATGVTCHVEWSDDLAAGTWSRDNVVQSVVEPDDDPDLQHIKATVPRGGGSKRFLRLRVSQP